MWVLKSSRADGEPGPGKHTASPYSPQPGTTPPICPPVRQGTVPGRPHALPTVAPPGRSIAGDPGQGRCRACFRECWHLGHSATVPCKRTIPLRGACPAQTCVLTAAPLPAERCSQPAPPAVNEQAASHHVGPKSSGAPSCLGLDEPRGQAFRERPGHVGHFCVVPLL